MYSLHKRMRKAKAQELAVAVSGAVEHGLEIVKHKGVAVCSHGALAEGILRSICGA